MAQIWYQILLILGIVIALVFSLLIFFTGKGDAMAGGSSVRTSFKGKASFEDFISKITLYLGIGFMALMIVLDLLGNRIYR